MNTIKSSFITRLLALVLLPVLVVSLVLAISSSIKLSNEMDDAMISRLKSSAYAIRTFMAEIADGESFSVKDDTLYAGEKDLTSINEVLDRFTNDSGMYATVFFGDTRRLTSVEGNVQVAGKKRAIGTQADKKVSAQVLGGQEYTSLSTTVVGQECVVAYIPLQQPDGKVCGMVFAGAPKADYVKTVRSAIMMTVVIAVVILAITIAIAVVTAKTLSKAVIGVSRVCNDLAEGDFTKAEASDGINRPDAVGDMVKNINHLKTSFNDTLGGVRQNINVLVDSAEGLDGAAEKSAQSMNELSSAVEGIANGATTQAQEVETSAREVADILRTVDSINESVIETEECAAGMEKNSKGVVDSFKVLLEDTRKTIEKLGDITEKMKHVQDAVETVTTAANDINSIASQTNLLSLNASIEAARAGEAGRGFAVVAGEISTLADQSNNAAVKIRNIMANLKEETAGAVNMVCDMSAMMDKQQETSEQSQASLNDLINDIGRTREMVNGVKRNADEVQQLCNGLNDNITSLSAISQENAASAEETSASIMQITDATRDVQEMSNQMKEVAATLDRLTVDFRLTGK